MELLEPLEDLKTKHLNEASMSHVGVLAALILAAAQAVEPLYFVHRISIAGNIVTHDEVIRRELGLVEGGVFDLQALARGVDRINQLGYFKPLTGHDVAIREVGAGLVDIEVRVEERRGSRPVVSGGTSENGGIFGSVSYTLPNLLGRGRTLSTSIERGSHDSLVETTLTEPHLFRSTSGSVTVSSQTVAYPTRTGTPGFVETRQGLTMSLGKSVSPFARVSFGYTYEVVSLAGAANGGRHVDGHIAPGFVYDTVDDAFLPHRGTRIAGGLQIAGPFVGGQDGYIKSEIAATWYRPTSTRTGFGLRAQTGALAVYGGTTVAPFYVRYLLGGENQIRGVDVRTVSPRDASGLLAGGTSFVLFNAEYHVDLTRRVRLLAFHDAGQAFAERRPFSLSDLRTSSGVELRVVVPKLNVPLRFIYYWNASRDSFQPAQGFRLAIGATF